MNNSGTTVVQVAGAVVTALAQVGVPGVAGPLNSPTGTGFVHTTAGAIDAAARAVNLASNGVGGDVTGVAAISNGGTGLSALGTALQVLQVNSGGTALVYGNVPLATVVAPTGSGVAMVASGVWVAAASLGTAGQILVTNSGATAAAWVSASQDATLTAAGAVTVVAAQAGKYLFGASTGLITVTSGETAPGLIQATTGASATGAPFTIASQASTGTPGTLGLYCGAVPLSVWDYGVTTASTISCFFGDATHNMQWEPPVSGQSTPPTFTLHSARGYSPVAGAGGAGGLWTIKGGNGGNSTGGNLTAGLGAGLTLQGGSGGTSTGTSANANGGPIILNSGAPGTGGSGAAGAAGNIQLQINSATYLKVSNAGNVTMASLGLGVVHSSAAGLLTSGLVTVGDITPSGTTGDVLTTTVGGTTVAWAAIPSTPAGTAGQIYVTNAVPVATWATMTGDAVISSAAVLRVESLQYGQTAAATIDASAGTINFALGASAVGITQTTITSTATPYNMVFTPQTSTHASGTTGHVIFNFQAPTAAASYNTVGRLKCQTGGVTTFAVGGADAYWGNAIFFGDPSASNAVIFNNGNANYTFFNAGSLLAGTIAGAYYIFQGTTSDIKFGSNIPNVNFSFGAPTTDSSSGGAIYIAAAATNPTHAISGSCAIYSDHTTGAFSVYPPGVTSYAFGVGSYGSGVGVVSIQAAATVPATAPSGGGVLYCGNSAGDAKVINWWDTDTSNIAMAASGANAGIIFTQHTGAQVNIGIATASSGNGQELAIGAGSTSAATGAAGGALYLNSGGSSNAGGGSSGSVTLATGVSVGSSSGQIIIETGTAASAVGTILVSPGGVNVLSVGSLGSGVGVVQLQNATTQPTGTPSNSVYLTSDAGKFQIYDSNGLTVTHSGLGITFGGSTSNVTIGYPSVAGSASNLNIIGQAATGGGNIGGNLVLAGGSSGSTTGAIISLTSGQGASTNGGLTISSGTATTYGSLGVVSSGNTPGAWTWKGAALSQTQATGGGGKSTLNVATGSFLFMPVTINGISCQIVLCT